MNKTAMQLHIEELEAGIQLFGVMKSLAKSDIEEIVIDRLIVFLGSVIDSSKECLPKEQEQIEEAYNAGYNELKYNRETSGSAYYLGKYKS